MGRFRRCQESLPGIGIAAGQETMFIMASNRATQRDTRGCADALPIQEAP
jgi:hypothetical protein